MDDYRNELAGIRRFNNPELYKKTVELQEAFAKNGIAIKKINYEYRTN